MGGVEMVEENDRMVFGIRGTPAQKKNAKKRSLTMFNTQPLLKHGQRRQRPPLRSCSGSSGVAKQHIAHGNEPLWNKNLKGIVVGRIRAGWTAGRVGTV